MLKGQKSVRGGIEDFLCPFTDMFITQAPNESYSHKGIMAIDVRGAKAGIKYPYFAPATSKCLKTYPESGQVMWQTVNNVRCSNGYIGKVTYMTVHDDTMDAKVGQIVNQGSQLGNMGKKGNATGVHCHIEFSQSADTTWRKNQYGNYMFNNEVDPEDVWFMDNTNVISGTGRWKYIKDVPVDEPKQEEHKPVIDEDKVEIQELKKQVNNLNEEKRKLTDANNAKDELLKALNKKIEVLENRIVEVTEERDALKENQPTLIFTCSKTAAYQIKLYENEKLFIA